MAPRSAPLVRVVRSGLEESVHLGDVAVCDPAGRLIASAGDPNRLVFVRSCTKPVQAAVAVDAIGLELSDRLVAIMAASHNGEPVHLRAVRDVLSRGGLTVADLQTPADRPLDGASARRVREPRPLYHNCSGKHAGMLLASTRAGWPTATYRRRSHPLQRRILRAVERLSGSDDVALGIDGCGVPVPGGGLRALISGLEQLGLLGAGARRRLAKRASPPVFGGGRPVGRLEPVVRLRGPR